MKPFHLALAVLAAAVSAIQTSAQIPNIGPVGEIKREQTGFQFTEGPASDLQGNVYFSDVQRNRIHKIDTQGVLTTFLENQPSVNGLMFDPRGRLIACQSGRIVAIDPATQEVSVLASQFENTNFQGPNDLAVDRQGNVYFSDRTAGPVYFIAADRTVKRLFNNLAQPNGVLLSTDEKTLYVLYNQPTLAAFPITAPGQLGEPKMISLQGTGGGDGMTLDTQGNLYVTRPNSNGVQVLKPTGESLGLLTFSEAPSNCTFGGPDMKTLFVTARTSVYTARMQTIGHRLIGNTASLSAASFAAGAPLARDSIVSLFGNGLAATTQAASSLPLPTTLAGTAIKVVDSTNTERTAALFFVSPTQINYHLPLALADGAATVVVTAGNGSIFTESVRLAATAPGLFSVNANGQGPAAALALRVLADNTQRYEPVARFDQTLNRWITIPLEFGAGEQLFLILYGTGVRNLGASSNATVTVGGTVANVSFAGAQGDLIGVDQLNVVLPRALTGRGEVDVVLTVGAQTSNAVKINFK
ncbi:MAG: SMP-30/gluconolactonase/LRE family protein [Acidobacteria bacterium]|nr:SMP-30/gluconolactonase/LRE family protein [Acidobacteriota bacterium]MBI3427718.1 SMP-30/gluconolactonase/LRE family protein [Acidobacteriota bacterium]